MGEAHARELARRGARVGLGDIDPGAVDTVVASLEADGATARGYPCDVRDAAAVSAFVDGAAKAFGGVDIVVSNAGIGDRAGGIGDTTDEQWRQQFSVHVDGAFHLVRAAVPWPRRSRHPRIVIVSSEWALRGPGFATDTRRPRARCWPSRATSRSSWPRMECSLNAIAPGTIATRMTADEDLVAGGGADAAGTGRRA